MAALAALGGAACLAVMLFASRLPPGPEFILPRRGGYALYQAFWTMLSSSTGRRAFSWAITLMLAACAFALAWSLRPEKKRPSWKWNEIAGTAVGPLFAAFLAWRVLGHSLDLIQLVWFPYGTMNAWEPVVAFVLFAIALVPAVYGAHGWMVGARRKALGWFGVLISLEILGAVGGAFMGVGRPLPVSSEGRTVYMVLTDGPSGPGQDVYSLSPNVFGSHAPGAVPSGARRIPALRARYEDATKRWDETALRDALLLGVNQGDPAAPSLLLSHLTSAKPSAEGLAALGVLADESRWRVGPLGAAALARAYAHQGAKDAADVWAKRAGGPGGIAPGLLGLRTAPARGKITGSVRAPIPYKIALYSKADPAAPYLLDAAGFVASTAPDARGRFSFSGLPEGRYYLALAFPDLDRGEASVSGSRGDLVLDAAHPVLTLPTVEVHFTPR